MIDHIFLAVRNYAVSKKFFAAALAPLGYELTKEFDGKQGGFGSAGKTDFWIGEAGAVLKAHIAFRCADRGKVMQFHHEALAAGGKDNGAPGVREHYHANYYAAFVLDPDGNNIEVVCHSPVTRA